MDFGALVSLAGAPPARCSLEWCSPESKQIKCIDVWVITTVTVCCVSLCETYLSLFLLAGCSGNMGSGRGTTKWEVGRGEFYCWNSEGIYCKYLWVSICYILWVYIYIYFLSIYTSLVMGFMEIFIAYFYWCVWWWCNRPTRCGALCLRLLVVGGGKHGV